jgi:hypothetical protein
VARVLTALGQRELVGGCAVNDDVIYVIYHIYVIWGSHESQCHGVVVKDIVPLLEHLRKRRVDQGSCVSGFAIEECDLILAGS